MKTIHINKIAGRFVPIFIHTNIQRNKEYYFDILFDRSIYLYGYYLYSWDIGINEI